jgi:hypothetical protein
MRYNVLCAFTDSQDNKNVYQAGDIYPRLGYIPTKKRIAELSGENNTFGKPIIELVKEDTNKEEKSKDEPKSEEKKYTRRTVASRTLRD